MAQEKKTTYIVDLNGTRALDENGNVVRPHLYGGSSKAILAYVYNGSEMVKVYNQAEYVFEAETHHDVEATAQTIDPVVASCKYDYNPSTKSYDILADENVEYTGILELERNDSEDERSGTFTVLQPKSGLSFDCTYTQAGKQLLGYYIDTASLYVESVNYDSVGASGGDAAPYITVKAKRYASYSNGTSEYEGYAVGSAYVSGAKGSQVQIDEILEDYTLPSFNTSTGVVSVSSLGYNETDNPITVYSVTYLEGGVVFEDHDDVLSWTWSGYVSVEQDTNSRILVDTEYYIDSYLPKTSIEETDTSFSVRGYAYKTDYYRYDAVSTLKGVTSDIILYVTLNDAPESVQYISGTEEMSVTFSVGANTGSSERVFSVQAYNDDAGYSEEYTVTQAARAFTKYTVVSVEVTSVQYEEAMPYASTCSPDVVIRIGYRAEYSDGTSDPVFYESQSASSISSAGGSPYNSSGATINTSTGVVSVPALPYEYVAAAQVFTVTRLSGSVTAELTGTSHSWSWNGSVAVEQMENNYERVDTQRYRTSSVASHSIGYSNEYVTVNYRVRDYGIYKWESDANWEATWAEVTADYPLTISISGDYSDSEYVTDGQGSVSFHVGSNSSTTSERNFTVKVYSSSFGTIGTHEVTQGVNVYTENWSYPVLNGSIEVGTVPAGGGSVTVYVPIYQVKTSNVGDVVEEYEKTVAAIALSGTVYSGSVSGGSISADTLGTTEVPSATLLYTITGVTVTGGDGVSYDLSLPSSVKVYQQANIKTRKVHSSAVSIGVWDGGFQTSYTVPSQGGVISFTIYANDYVYYEYTSGSKTSAVEVPASGVITTTLTDGYLSATTFTEAGGVVGIGASITVYENTDADRTFTVTATVTSGKSVSSSLTISQEKYVQPTREKARIEVAKCRYTSSARTTVEYEFYFDATDTDSYSGGTFSDVYVLLMDALGGSGNQWDSESIGTVTVAEGGTSATYNGTLSVGSATNRYLIIRDNNGILFQSGIEDPEG